MAFYSFGRVKIVSRAKGKSAVAKAAYHAAIKLVNEYDGEVHDFTKKKNVGETVIRLPEGVPERWKDESIPAKERVGIIWNDIEQIHGAYNAQLARSNYIAFTNDLTYEENIICLERWIKKNCTDRGMGAIYSFHNKPRNPHVDMMYFIAEYDASYQVKSRNKKEYLCRKSDGTEAYLDAESFKASDGFEKIYKYKNSDGKRKDMTPSEVEQIEGEWERINKYPVCRTVKISGWDERSLASDWRKSWEEELNKMYASKGMSERVDCRSYKEQGKEEMPTVHEGYGCSATERKKYNECVKNFNKKKEELLKIVTDALDDIDNQTEELKWVTRPIEIEEHKERFDFNKRVIEIIINSSLFVENTIAKITGYLKNLEAKFHSLCDIILSNFGVKRKNEELDDVENEISSTINDLDSIIHQAFRRSEKLGYMNSKENNIKEKDEYDTLLY